MELGVEHKQESAFSLRTGLRMATPHLRIRKEKAQNCLRPEFSRVVVGLKGWLEWCGNREKRQRGVLLLPIRDGL